MRLQPREEVSLKTVMDGFQPLVSGLYETGYKSEHDMIAVIARPASHKLAANATCALGDSSTTKMCMSARRITEAPQDA